MTPNEVKKKKIRLALSSMPLIIIVLVSGIMSVQQSFASPYALQSPSGTNATSGNTGTINNPSNTISVVTDKLSYNYGDTITISGTTNNYLDNMPVTIIIHDPMGILVAVDQTFLGTDRTYSASISAAGPTWQAAGTYQVKAQYGISYATTTFQFTAGGQTVVTPLSPTSLTAFTISSTEIDLSWTAPTNTGGAQLYGYKIERNDGSDFNQIQNTQTTSYQDTGLVPNKLYSYRVYAVNQAGTSDPSNVATSVTLSPSVQTTIPPANEIDIALGAGGSTNAACVVANTCFYPNPLYVAPGTTVTWNNTDLAMHTVTSGHASDSNPGSLFGSGFIGPIHPIATPHPSTFSFAFANAGIYDYFDILHPWMTGQIIVGSSSQPNPQFIPSPPPTSSISGNSWYPGKGLKQGDYFSYNVCWTDWHNCSPLQMSFWVKNETSDRNGWNVVFMTVDGSIVQKGIMTIGKITPDPTSFDSNISDYAGVYRSTVSWMDSFATKDSPKSFDVSTWGRTGSVGGQSVGPISHEKVTVGAGTFDTYVLGWHKGVDNKIWVDPNVPFPVKAFVYVGVTTGSPPPDYTLELLKMGNSQTEPDVLKGLPTNTISTSAQCNQPNMEQDSVHQVTTTDSGSMVVEYGYSPSNLHNGCPIEFRLSFQQNFDQSKFSNLQYDIFIVDDNDHQLYSLAKDKGRTALFAPVGDDDNTFVMKGTTPVTHFVIAALGTGPEGSLPDTTAAGLVRVDVKTQSSFGSSSISAVNNIGTTTMTIPHPPIPQSNYVFTPTQQDIQNINQAKANQTIAAEVNVGASQAHTTSIDNNVSVQTTSNTPDSLNVNVSASSQTGPKVIAFNLNTTTINVANLKDLGVMYDGKLIQPAPNMDAILHAKPTDSPSFAIVVTQSGVQVLVLVPHFSTHSITITNMSKVIPAIPEFGPIVGMMIIISLIGVVVISKLSRCPLLW